MAMATSTQLSSSLFHSQITKKPFLLPATISVHGFSTRRLKSLSLSHRSSVSALSASSAVDVTEPVKKPVRTLPFRVGHGFDLHRLEPGYPLIIGGIDIPHDRGCEAHSDGDVLLHCVVDAILGALGLPDIGQIFPDSDPKWKGAASSVFIKEAVRLMDEAGYEIGNLDATLILQRPKISPHKETIRSNLSKLLGADPSVVNLKAKTHEKVDSLGENRSIAAHTVILLMKKTGNILDVGNMVRKVTSVRQFRLNSMLYVSGPMNQQKATQEYSPIVNRLHLMSDLTTKKNKKNSKLPSSILLY